MVLCVAACDCQGRTAIVVDVQTDFVPIAEFVQIAVERFDSVEQAREPAPAPLHDRLVVLALPTIDYALGTRIGELDVAAGSHVVRATLFSASGAQVARTLAVTSVEERAGITMVLTRSCASVACPRDTDPSTAITCLAGHCVDPGCTPDTPERCGAEVGCASASQCQVPEASCAEAACIGSVCLARPIPDSCGPDFYCAAEIGCIQRPSETPDDAGLDSGIDAATMDAASDARDAFESGVPADTNIDTAADVAVTDTNVTDTSVTDTNVTDTSVDTLTDSSPLDASDAADAMPPDPGVPWGFSAGGIGGDEANAIAVNADGRIFAGGAFEGTAAVGTEMLTSSGQKDAFVVSLTADGTLDWTWHYGRDSGDLLQALAAAPNGDVIAVGAWSPGRGDYGAGVVGDPAGTPDMLVHRINPMGETIWSRWIAGDGTERGTGVAVDPAGEIYVAGFGSGTWTEDGLNHVSDARDALIARLAPNGTTRWATTIGGPENQEPEIAANGALVCVSLTAYGDVDFPDMTRALGRARRRAAVACFDADGNHLWSDWVGTPQTPAPTVDIDTAGIALDDVSNVYVGLTVGGTVTLQFGAQDFTSDAADGLVVSYNSAGAFRWARAIVSPDTDDLQGLCWDPSGRLLLTGHVGDAGAVGGVPILPPPGGGDDEIFAAAIDASGTTLWSQLAPTMAGDDLGMAVAASRSTAIFVGGYTTAPLTHGGTLISNAGDRDFVVLKFVP